MQVSYCLCDDLARPFNEPLEEFKTRILLPMKRGKHKVAIQRIHVVLKSILLRRTKTCTDKNGNPILKLPEREIVLIEEPFRDPSVTTPPLSLTAQLSLPRSDEAAFYEASASKLWSPRRSQPTSTFALVVRDKMETKFNKFEKQGQTMQVA